MKIFRQLVLDSGLILPKSISRNPEKRLMVAEICSKWGIKNKLEITEKAARAVVREIENLQIINPELLADVLGKVLTIHHLKLTDRMQKRKVHTVLDYASEMVICNLPASHFYKSPEWRQLRYRVLERKGNVCVACGSSPKDGSKIHVDHIKPRSIYPELALDINNLQVLCEDCNLGKLNKYQTDWEIVNGQN